MNSVENGGHPIRRWLCLPLGPGRHRQSKKHEHGLIEPQDIFVVQSTDACADFALWRSGNLVHHQASPLPKSPDYGGGFRPATLHQEIRKVRYPGLELSHLYPARGERA
jgi:hypothetical protein